MVDILEYLKPHFERLCIVAHHAVRAHTCTIFLPLRYPEIIHTTDLELVSSFSSSNALKDSLWVSYGEGLIGWVSQRNRPLRLTPLPEDYFQEWPLYEAPCPSVRSFLGVPILLSEETNALSGGNIPTGVIACDSTEANSFTKEDEELLRTIGEECASLLSLQLPTSHNEMSPYSNEGWRTQTSELFKVLSGGVSLIQIRITSHLSSGSPLHPLEREARCAQIMRLLTQTLPPHFPFSSLCQGDIIIALDSMMSSFFLQKIEDILLRSLKEQGFMLSRICLNIHSTTVHSSREFKTPEKFESLIASAMQELELSLEGLTSKAMRILPQETVAPVRRREKVF